MTDESVFDLVQRLLVKSRRWELYAVMAIVAASFSAGGAVMLIKIQFEAVKDTLVSMQRDLDSRTLSRNAQVTALQTLVEANGDRMEALENLAKQQAESNRLQRESFMSHEEELDNVNEEMVRIRQVQLGVVRTLDAIATRLQVIQVPAPSTDGPNGYQ